MGRFKAGDRVNILAGHPYHAGRPTAGEAMTGVVKNDEGKVERRRGKYIVDIDGGTAGDYSFKGRELELQPAAAAVPALRLEAGKFYRDADGDRVGPMGIWNEFSEHSWDNNGGDGDRIFRADGTSKYNPHLVCEWIGPAAPKADAWVPTVGDNVRVKDDRGDKCIVTHVDDYGDGGAIYCRLSGLSTGAEGLYSYRLEPMQAATTSAPLHHRGRQVLPHPRRAQGRADRVVG